MKTESSKEVIAGSVNQSRISQVNEASDIVNMRLDDRGDGWVNDRGWELAEYPNADIVNVNQNYFEYDKTALYIWERHRGAEVYKIFKLYSEANNSAELLWAHHNIDGSSALYPSTHTIGFDRSIPKSDDPDEQYAPYGRFLCIVNGKDSMLKFWGRDLVEPFGFTKSTPQLELIGPDTDFFNGTCNLGGTPHSSFNELEANKIALKFVDGEGAGMGTSGDSDNNWYGYRMTFVTDTGSESPLSAPVYISWTNQAENQDENGADMLASVFLNNIPVGPPGTVARRIYRTKTLKSLQNQTIDPTFYFLKQISNNTTKNYIDITPDTVLSTAAPAETDSAVISSTYKYNSSWDNRMWLAGGQGNETKIIYSEKGLPEQFPSFNYFDVGNRSGGSITQIFPYYDNILIFREKAIDVIRSASGSASGYILTRLSSDIGTTASNTIATIPGVGVIFLSYDNVYIISGGLVGGSTVNIVPVGDKIKRELNRISKSSLPRATAAYSRKENEWWCFYPVDGTTKNKRSIVFHRQNNGWSLRHNLTTSEVTMDNAFSVNALSTLPDGIFIAAFENSTTITNNSPTDVDYAISPGELLVWTANQSGDITVNTNYGGEAYSYVSITEEDVVSQWQSSWLDFGDDSIKKRILSVEVSILTWGHNEISLLTAVDQRDDETPQQTLPTAVAELYGTSSEDAIYLPAAIGPFDNSLATIDTAQWGERKIARLRFDVKTALVSWFRFKLQSSSNFQVVSYQINYTVGSRTSINMAAGKGVVRS